MNFKVAIRQFIYLLLIFSFSVSSFAQSNFKSEADLKKKADELFLEGEYVQAYPLYSQLLSLYPKDYFYNFRFGACIIYAEKDKEKAIKYLEYAVSKPDIDVEAHFFLGKAYHINYRFDDAIRAYTTFKSKAGNKKRKLLNPEREIEMCQNGKNLLSNITDIIVVEKKEVPRSDFFRTYETSKFGGKILAKPDELKSSYDKKVKENSVIFVPSTSGGEIFYSSYGDNDKNGKDIYKVKRLPNGEFSPPQNIGFPINTPFDEEYPILHPNGRILYFCSKGHNSMGGYDVFKSTFDNATQTWSTPVNLDFAINTPDDDILFIADENNEEAYFSSTRASVGSNIGVYKILMVRKPVDLVTIKGNFKHFNENYDKEVKISVRTINDNVEIAAVKTDEESGDYLINIPHGAKYKFVIEGEGFATQTGVVDIPTQENPRPLKQEMELVNINGEARLMIKNLFDEEVPGLAFTPPIDVIRKKARLDVNYNEAEAKRLKEKQAVTQPTATTDSKTGNNTAQADKTAVKTTEQAGSISNQQLIEMAKSDVDDLKKEAAVLREEADFAYAFAKLKSEESRNSSSPQSEQFAKEAVLAYNLAIEIDNQASAKEREAQKAEKYAADIEKAIKSNSNKEALAILEKQRQELANDKKEELGAEGALATMREKAVKKRAEADRYETKANESKEDAEAIQIEITVKEAEIAKTKDNAQKEKLKGDLNDLKTEYDAVKKQSENFASRSVELKKEAANIEYDVELLTRLIDTYKNEADDASYADLSNEEKAGLKSDISSLQGKAKQAEEQNLAANQGKSSTNQQLAQQNKSNNENKSNKPTESSKSATSNKVETENNIPFKHNHLNENGTIADYNTAYMDDLDRVAGIDNEFEKNASIATINNNWANTIQAEISYRNENLNKLNKKERKAEEQKIASLEQQRDEKRKSSAEAQAKVQQLFAANTQKSNEQTNTATAQTSQTVKQQQNIENEDDEEEEEDVKVVATNTANKTSNPVTTQAVSQNQNQVQTQTQTQTTASPKSTQQIAQTNKATEQDDEEEEDVNVASTSKTQAQSNSDTQSTTTQQMVASPNVSSEVFTSQEYTFTAAQSENKRSQGHALEAELLSRRAQKLRDEAAAMNNEEERKAAFKEADELDKKAEEKREESALAAAKANQAEYLNLESAISNTALKIKNKNAPEVDMASLLREEAQYYFNEAKQMRESGLKAPNNTSKLNALERANIIEKDAIEKQQRSLELYAKAANMSVSDALALSGSSTTPAVQSKTAMTASATTTTTQNTSSQTAAAKTNTQTVSAATNQTTSVNYTATTSANNTAATTTQSQMAANQEQQKRNQRIAQLEKEIADEQKNIDTLEEEANDLEKEVADLKKKADETKKKKDKAVAEEVYRAKNEEAIAKRNEVLKANDNLERLQEELSELKSQGTSTAIAQNNQTSKSLVQNNKQEDEEEEDDVYNDSRPKTSANQNSTSAVNTSATNAITATVNTNKQLSPSEAARVGASPEWNQYYSLLSNSEAAQRRADNDKQEATQLRKDAFALNQKAEELNEKADDIEDEDEKEEVLANAKQIEEQANAKLSQADAKENSAKQNEGLAIELRNQSNNYLQSQNTATQENLIAYNKMQKAAGVPSTQSVATTNTTNAVNNVNSVTSNNQMAVNTNNATASSNQTVRPAAANSTSSPSVSTKRYEIPKQLNEEIFDRTNAVVYNESNPIPVDVELPEGLIFKVQVGAFRNRIPQDLFKGFAPVTGETTPSGLTRYTAGFFKAFETADLAKDVIKGYGYEDAFVVAFFNGKRISINEARQIMKNQGVSTPVVAQQTNEQSNAQNYVQTTSQQIQTPVSNNQNVAINNQVNQSNISTEEPPLINEPGTAAYRMVDKMQGLLYTVQCGVYTRPVPPAQLFNIQPLLVEKTANGMLRYTSGVYNDVNTAVQAKNRIVEYGIKDAFVTAYYNGKRISVAEAKAIEASNGKTAFVNSSDMNKMPYQGANAVVTENRNVITNTTVAQPATVNQNAGTSTNNTNTARQPVTVQGLGTTATSNVDKTKPVYKVQIGAFKEEVPIELAVIYMKLAPKGVNYRLREDGFTVYTVGATNSIEEANRLKQEVINEGITDAFLVAFENEKQVPIIGTINNNNKEIKVINPVNDEENEDEDE
jgi:hypothetical protein